MRYLPLILLLLCGCVATEKHVKKGDIKVADFGEAVYKGFKKLAEDKPELIPVVKDIEHAAEGLSDHAKQPAGFEGVETAAGGLMGLALAFATGGLPVGLIAVKKILDDKKSRGHIRKLADMSPEQSKDHIRQNNVKT